VPASPVHDEATVYPAATTFGQRPVLQSPVGCCSAGTKPWRRACNPGSLDDFRYTLAQDLDRMPTALGHAP
jgi:hypothetical protein